MAKRPRKSEAAAPAPIAAPPVAAPPAPVAPAQALPAPFFRTLVQDAIEFLRKRWSFIVGALGLFLGFLAITKTLQALTDGLAWIDKRWEAAISFVAIAAGMGAFSLVMDVLKPDAQGDATTPAATQRRREILKASGAFLACLLAIGGLGTYLWLYHHCVVTLDDHARRVLAINAAPDDAAAKRMAAEGTLAPADRLVLPIFLPGEIKRYNDGIVRHNPGIKLPGKGHKRAGISHITSYDPQWLFDKLEHDYPQNVAWTKLTLMGVYVGVFTLVGLAAGLSYRPVESMVQLFASGKS